MATRYDSPFPLSDEASPEDVRVQLTTYLQKHALDGTCTPHVVPEMDFGQLPGQPWERRLLVAWNLHRIRQQWVGHVVQKYLGINLAHFASRTKNRSQPLAQSGKVPGLPHWKYNFHGVGCILTHDDGTYLDVDFDERGTTSIDPWFYQTYLDSQTHPDGLEQLLVKPEPYSDWWQADLTRMKELGWIEGNHRYQLTELGIRWAEALDTSMQFMTGAATREERCLAAQLLQDYEIAYKETTPELFHHLQARMTVEKEKRVAALVHQLRKTRCSHSLVALSMLDRQMAIEVTLPIVQHSTLDKLTSTALELIGSWNQQRWVPILLQLAQRAKSATPPGPHVRTYAIELILRQFRDDTIPDTVRDQAYRTLAKDAGACEGIAAFLATLLHTNEGLKRLTRTLHHTVPTARMDAACFLALLGTADCAQALRLAETNEAEAALSLLRGRSANDDVSVQDDFAVPSLTTDLFLELDVPQASENYRQLLQRWWAH
jgi:hypothetical protein